MIELQSTSSDILTKKYLMPGENIGDMQIRVAKALANQEDNPDKWFPLFLGAIKKGCVPAGRILSNAGAESVKTAVSTINCTVSRTIEDSMDGIMDAAHDAAMTLKAGCGIGYEFSTLRPKGAFVSGAGASTSGPLPFMDIFDRVCATVSSAGGRRGAQMATFDISHPDVIDFISAKREDGRLRHFNLSVLISELFMDAVEKDADWPLVFKANKHEIESGDYEIVERDGIAYRVYNTVKARSLWDLIMRSTYDYAEPGFILIDRANNLNNNWFCEDIRASNPCGEQVLPPHGACLLGSINLTSFVVNPFRDSAGFDWNSFAETVAIFTRMLDNVVEINGLPLEGQRKEIIRKRRHGMGYMGLGSALTMMKIPYGSPDAVSFTRKMTFELAKIGFQTGVKLASEKGCAPVFEEEYEVDDALLAKMELRGITGYKVGDKVRASELWLASFYIQSLLSEMDPSERKSFVRAYQKHGCRFTHHSSIAPTGTIALSVGNNCSNGIEPSFSHHYVRNVIVEGKKTKDAVDVFSYELLAYRKLVDPDALPGTLPSYFVSADSVTPREHVDMQAAAQTWVDSSISKTINVPSDYPFEDFQSVYMYAYKKGLKGCSTFRFNPERFQGVLVRQEDLESTTYRFTLEDGSVVEAKGNEQIQYDGEIHTAANLFDSLKEGTYGSY